MKSVTATLILAGAILGSSVIIAFGLIMAADEVYLHVPNRITLNFDDTLYLGGDLGDLDVTLKGPGTGAFEREPTNPLDIRLWSSGNSFRINADVEADLNTSQFHSLRLE
jgi:hypothetical protein